MGYSANYAIWVHEMPETTDWSRPGSGPKWFERKLKKHAKKMLSTIGHNAKISLVKGFPATKQLKARTDTEKIK